jgi:ribonuclease P protein component
VIYVIEKQDKYYRFGISIPKKVGNSVLRNKLKRQIKDIIDKNNCFNKNLDYVIIVRKEIITLKYNDMSFELLSLLTKIDGVWKSEKI